MKIQTVECCPKDTIVIRFKMIEDYDMEFISNVFKNIQSTLPDNPVVFVPENLIEDITVISSHPKYLEMGVLCEGAPAPSYPFSTPYTGGKDLW